MSIGRASNYVIWSGAIHCRASKYIIWSGAETCHLVGHQDISFFYISSGRAIKYVITSASKYIIWSDVELCHLVGRRNRSFGGYSKICHLVRRRNMPFGWASKNFILNMSFGRALKQIIW